MGRKAEHCKRRTTRGTGHALEAYEQKHYRIDPPNPIEAIKFRMDQFELKPSDLTDILGGRNRASRSLVVGSLMKKLVKVCLDAPLQEGRSCYGSIPDS